MAAVKAAIPTQIFGREDWARLTQVSRWKGVALVVHAWAVIFAAIGVAVWSGHWALWLLAIIIVGGRQLGLAILMHDAAHGLLHPDRKTNNFLGQWLTGVPVGTDLHAYRTYHLTHHRYTQQPEDPDLPLSAPFPTTRSSMGRKVLRDLTGIVFLKQRGGQVAMATKSVFLRTQESRAAQIGARRTGLLLSPETGKAKSDNAVILARFLFANLILLGISFATGYGALPYLIWLIALATTFQLFLRIRNIAEHACTTTGSDDPFTHARTTYANLLERATVAPYWVNYHSEHHLFMGVPCYNLPEAHAMLGTRGLHERMTISRGYWDVLRTVVKA